MSAAPNEDCTRPWSLLPELEHFKQVPQCRVVQHLNAHKPASVQLDKAGMRYWDFSKKEIHSSAAMGDNGPLPYFWSLPTNYVWSILCLERLEHGLTFKHRIY